MNNVIKQVQLKALKLPTQVEKLHDIGKLQLDDMRQALHRQGIKLRSNTFEVTQAA